MTTAQNTAAWLPARGERLEVKHAPYTPPRADEIVIKNHAVAVNPVDWITQEAGAFAASWIRYPFVLGSDVAGEVVEIGKDVTRFSVGDRVLGHAIGWDPKRNSAAEGSFQNYTVILERMSAPIPITMSYENAAVLPLGLSTAACGLFQKDQLALDYPSACPKRNGKVVIVWGGSTSVGSNAIQLAVAAGYDVVATASPKNFQYVKNLGAAQVFDYKSSTVVKDIVSALRGKTIAGAIAIGRTSGQACLDIVHECSGNKFVSMATFPVSFSGSATPRIVRLLRLIFQAVPFMAALIYKTRSRGIRTKFIFGSSLAFDNVSTSIYQNFLPDALAKGQFVAAPPPLVAGTGLECIQAALDIQKQGVSARKVVVSLQH